MSKKFYVVHRRDLNNVGDMASNPLQYFLNPSEYESIDIIDLMSAQIPDNATVIAGGGGLIANQFMDDALRALTVPQDHNQLLNLADQYWKVCSSGNSQVRQEFFSKLNPLVKEYLDKLSRTTGPRVIWGAGHNSDYIKKLKGDLEYPEWLRDFNLIGVRDYNQQYNWVPCASCMHPALRKKYPIKNDVIWFEHKKQLIKSADFGSKPIPRFINSGDNIDQTIELLGSANIVITNSYHGAYWATLLKKKVIVADPWSSKFNALKHMPRFLNKDTSWEQLVASASVYNDALDECVDVNQQFWNQVQRIS